MKKFNNLLFTLIACLLSISFIGCGSNISNSYSGESIDNSSNGEKPQIELIISAAASLKEAMADIQAEYSSSHPEVALTFNFGASGSLQKQIEQGAPCDLFISAGQSQMKALYDEGLLEQDTDKDLVKNQLVLIGPKGTELTSINDLSSDSVKHIASGEPSSVPAGKYADEVLTNMNLKDSLYDKLTFAKDVKEVLAWTVSGNAEAGFVYKSDALNSDGAQIIEILPEDSHSPITYPVAVIKDSKNMNASKEFEDFLFSDTCKAIFEKYGYEMAKNIT